MKHLIYEVERLKVIIYNLEEKFKQKVTTAILMTIATIFNLITITLYLIRIFKNWHYEIY